jgi:multidrug efflux pump subunit AcrA (membrane-fusion protein)
VAFDPAALKIIDQPALPSELVDEKQVGLITGAVGRYAVQSIRWEAGSSPNPAQITSLLYTPHVSATSLPDALTNISSLWERPAALPHDYFYVIPLALAQCYQAMGDYPRAETYYLQAASYTYINTAIEGPYVWVGLANLYSVWGNSAYEQGDLTTAANVYGKVLTIGSTTPPSTPLYTLAGLSVAAKAATALIPQLDTLLKSGTSGVSSEDTLIASVLVKIYGKLTQLNAGLDFWGHWADAIPIWTFGYLQQVATNFTQFALDAEQQVVNFWSQADQATLTSTQLHNQAAEAAAQINVAQSQLESAQEQAAAYQAGVTLAQTRASNAAANASEYQSKNGAAIVLEAEAQQVNGGEEGNWEEVSDLASALLSGYGISGEQATIGAATQLAANKLSQEYQVDSMNRTAAEMRAAAEQAQAQLTAANAQVTAAQASLGAANLDANAAAQALEAFEADTFTPQVWRAMGEYMLGIYDRYMQMALAAAKLMQQAYNFENDTTLTYIKSSYVGVIDGLLAADALMADIQQFTYELITAKRGKKQYVKTSISLAQNYGYQFQTELIPTGEMAFETTLDDFDSVFPGSYAGRIQSVSVDIQGIVPPTGISGTLSNGGISFYRLPSDIATPSNPSKVRIQDADTLILSDYNPAVDPQLDALTGNQLGVFEGAGVASTWTLSLPKQLNNINYETLTDVVLTFLYETRFDPQLVSTVLSQLAGRPGYYDRQWAIPLAWLYPDLFYSFVATGQLTLSLSASDFALNQTAPKITGVSLLVAMAPGSSSAGITISLTPPGRTAVTGVTEAQGTISSQTTGSAWASAPGGSALGDWALTLPAASNPALAPGGKLDLSKLVNLVLVLDYSFTPRG